MILPGTMWGPRMDIAVHAMAVPEPDDAPEWGKFGVWIGLWIGDRDWGVGENALGVLITEDVDGEQIQVEVSTGEYLVFYPDGTIDIMSPERFSLLYRSVN